MKFWLYIIFIVSISSCSTHYTFPLSEADLDAVEIREIEIKGVLNARDLGGIRNKEKKSLKFNQIYRSGNLSKLKSEKELENLPVKEIIDLRTDDERRREKDRIPSDIIYKHYALVDDKKDELGGMRKKIFKGQFTKNESEKLVGDFYEQLIVENQNELSEVLHEVMQSNVPILIHCTAGKDRTGILTALLLAVADVDKEEIMKDYLLSNYFREKKINSNLKKAKFGKIIYPNLDEQVIKNLMIVDTIYLNRVFDVIDSKYGGMDNYLKTYLKVSLEEKNLFKEKILNNN